MSATEDVPGRRRRMRRLHWLLLAAAGVLLALAGGVAWLTATDAGLRRLASFAGSDVTVEGISGSLWNEVRIGRLAYQGEDGLAAEVRDATLSWSPWQLVRGVLQLGTVEAAHVSIVLPVSADSTDSEGFRLPRPPIAIRIERLDLPDIALAPAPGAEPHRFRASGHARVGDRGESVALDVRGIEPEDDTLSLDAAHERGAPGRLRIAADATLTADSPIWTLLGVTPDEAQPLRLTLQGDGPLDSWEGQLDARLGDGGAVRARIATDGAGRFTIGGEASIATGGLLNLPPELAGTTTFEVAGQAQVPSRVALSQISVQKPDLLRLDGAGWIDLAADDVSLDLTLTLDPAAARLLGEEAIAWSEASVSGRIEGAVGGPSMNGTARIAGLAAPALEMADVAIEWRIENTGRQASATVRMADARWSEAVLAGLLGTAPELDLTVGWGEDGAVRLEQLALRGESATGEASGVLAADRGIDGQAELRVPDLAALSASTGTDMAGSAVLRIDKLMRTSDGATTGSLSLSAVDARIGPPELAALLGNSPRLDANLRIAASGELTAEQAVLSATAADLTGRMTLDAGGTRLDAALQGLVRPEAAKALEGVSFDRPFDIALELAGELAAPTGKLLLSGPALEVSGTALAQPKATVQLAWRAGDPLLMADLEARVAGVPATARFEALVQPERVALSGIRVEAAGLRVQGELTLPEAGLPAAGRLTLAAGDLGTTASLIGAHDLDGTLRGTLTLTADGTRQAVRVDLRGEKLSLVPAEGAAPLSIRQLAVTGQVRDALAGEGLALDLTIAGLRRGDTLAVDGGATLRGSVAAPTLTVDLAGRVVAPFKVAASVAMTESGRQRRIQVERLRGTYDGRPVALAGPTYAVMGADGLSETAAAVRLGDGRVDARLARTSGRPSLTAKLDRLPLGPLAAAAGSNIGGQLSGSLDLSQTARGVGGRGAFNLHGVGVAGLKDVPPIDAQLVMTVEPAAVDLTLTVTGAGLREAEMRGRVPVRLNLSPPGGWLAGSGSMDLRLSLAGEAGTLWPYIGPPDQRLSGMVALTARLTGTPDAPRVDGTVRVDSGRYEHLIYGTLLTGLTLRADLADRQLTLREFRAGDGGGGTLVADGDVTLGTGGKLRFAMRAEGRGMHLLRRDDLRAVGDLDLRVEGDAAGAEVAGQITVNGAEIDLAAALPPAIPSLDVQRVGDPPRDKVQVYAAAYPIGLDVAIAIPGQAFVRGRGLDSEWRGRLNLKGTAAAPRLTGDLEAVRGQFDAIGRSFALRNSTIQFDGGARVDPILGIRGEYKTRDLTVVARLVGRASDPSLELDSTPSMPRDEILSRVLFGKARGRLTPLEGAQLAAALSELSGGGPGLDVLGTLRRMAGIDVLQVDSGDGAPSVRAGKYVTERVYVGARQGASAGSGGVEVEVELTPNISVNSSGEGGRSDVELLFKWDY